MIQVRDNRGNYHDALAIYDNAGREIKEVRNNQGRLLFKNWNEIHGSVPLSFMSRGAYLQDYRIYGNTVQNGTPTPENPVEVQGCGERTKNLLDNLGTTTTMNGVTFTVDNASGTVTANGKATSDAFFRITIPSNVTGNFYFSGCPEGGGPTKYNMYPWDATLNRRTTDWNGYPTTPETNNDYGEGMSKIKVVDGHTTLIACRIQPGYNAQNIVFRPMLRIPSESNEFEPCGYKIPVTVSDGTNTVTTPVYIGSEPLHKIGDYADYVNFERGLVVRQIKKVVLNGNESYFFTGPLNSLRIPIKISLPNVITTYYIKMIIASHYITSVSSEFSSDEKDAYTIRIGENTRVIWVFLPKSFFSGEISSENCISQFKAYLATQYAAGTPVTIWYALNEPEEEPLGNLLPIQTIKGSDVLTVDTTVQPSEIYIKGKIKSIT